MTAEEKLEETIKQIRERHKKEIDDYQSSCEHEKVTQMPYMWAHGHFGGDVLVCDRCEKIVGHPKT